MATAQPRGIRNNNPGNIDHRDPWQGLVPAADRKDKRFAEFTDPSWGIRALARVLIMYQDKYKIRTIRDAISRWAPPVENNTEAYIEQVAQAAGRFAGDAIDFHAYADLRPVVEAIIRHENGKGPLSTANTWYSNDVIDVALDRAGVPKPAAVVASVPVTKETVSATTIGALGIGQAAEVLPPVLAAIRESNASLLSGDWMKIGIAVVMIVGALVIAYSQVKKHKLGVVA